MNSDLAITGKSPLVKEASDIVLSGDRSQGAMERIEQISDQVIGEDKLIVGDLFEAFLVDGGIESDIQRTAKLSGETDNYPQTLTGIETMPVCLIGRCGRHRQLPSNPHRD